MRLGWTGMTRTGARRQARPGGRAQCTCPALCRVHGWGCTRGEQVLCLCSHLDLWSAMLDVVLARLSELLHSV
jgi:hypothetical protein